VPLAGNPFAPSPKPPLPNTVEGLLARLAELNGDRRKLLAALENVEAQKKVALNLLSKKITENQKELEALGLDAGNGPPGQSPKEAGGKAVEQKLDAVLERLEKMEKRLNEVEKGKRPVTPKASQ
jgi:hypothetical protein